MRVSRLGVTSAATMFVLAAASWIGTSANGAPIQPVSGRGQLCFSVAGSPGDAAIVNLTPIRATGPGDGLLISSDVKSDPPLGSTVNFGTGTVDPNIGVARIGTDGQVCFQNSIHNSVDLVADHLGTIAATAYTAAQPSGAPNRRVDTRTGLGGTRIKPSGQLCFSVAGSPGDAAIVNLTPIRATGPGDGLLISSDVKSDPPLGSTVNFGTGTVDPNIGVARIGTDGQVCFQNSIHNSVDLVADHLGTIAATAYTAAQPSGAPNRRVDTRTGLGGTRIKPSGQLCFSVAGSPGDAAIVNLTPIRATGPGDGLLISSDVKSDPPLGSTVNFGTGTVDPNIGVARIGTDGQVCFQNSIHNSVDLVADHLGTIAATAYTAAQPSGAPNRRVDTRTGLINNDPPTSTSTTTPTSTTVTPTTTIPAVTTTTTTTTSSTLPTTTTTTTTSTTVPTTPPSVSALTPIAGPGTGGTVVTITGTGFSGATSVTFGAIPGTNLIINSSTSITVTSPAGASTVDVRVATPVATSGIAATAKFTYTPTTEVIAHCGTVAVDESWNPSTVHVITCDVVVTDGAVLTINSGAVVKMGAGSVEVRVGGLVVFDGTAGSPVTATLLADDSVGGDSNGDGPLVGAPIWNGTESLVMLRGGSLRMVHTDVRWMSDPIIDRDYGSVETGFFLIADEFTIRDSTFTAPGSARPFPAAGAGATYNEPMRIWNRGCATGQVTGNTFTHARLELGGNIGAFPSTGPCSIPVASNTFNASNDPLWIHWHENIALVDLAGANANTFTGTPQQRMIRFRSGATVATGTEFVYDRPGVAVSPGILTNGTTRFAAGSLIKTDGPPVEVRVGGLVVFDGTAGSPVTATLLADDSVGGDSNGDGPLVGAPIWNGTESLVMLRGGSLRMVHTDVRWMSDPIIDRDYGSVETGFFLIADEFTIRDSTFTAPGSARPFPAAGAGATYNEPMRIWNRGCATGQVTGNTFTHARLELGGNIGAFPSTGPCSIPVASNTFNASNDPLWIHWHENIALVDLAGANANTFTGTPQQRMIRFRSGATVATGTEFVYDRPGVAVSPGILTNGTTRFAAGSLIKTDGPPVEVRVGGLVVFDGTAGSPVTATLLADDSVGGDSNGDGPLVGAPIWNGTESLVMLRGGSLRMVHTDVRWMSDPIIDRDYGSVETGFFLIADEFTIRDSTFTAPGSARPFPAAGAGATYNEPMRIWNRGCATGQVTGNTFTHARLELGGNIGAFPSTGPCSIPVASNTFNVSNDPLWIHWHENIALVDLAGANANTFTGTPQQRMIRFRSGATVATGTELLVDTSATIVINSVRVEGTLSLLPGTVIKVESIGFSVAAGGRLSAVGTINAPVIVTAFADDSVAGDTNGNGQIPLRAVDRADTLLRFESGNAAGEITHAVLRYAATAVSVGSLNLVVSVSASDFDENLQAIAVDALPDWSSLLPCAPPFSSQVGAPGNWFGPHGVPGLAVDVLDIPGWLGLAVPEEFADSYAVAEEIASAYVDTEFSISDNTVSWAMYECVVPPAPPVIFPWFPVLTLGNQITKVHTDVSTMSFAPDWG